MTTLAISRGRRNVRIVFKPMASAAPTEALPRNSGYRVELSRCPGACDLWDVRDDSGRIVYSGSDILPAMIWIERKLSS